MMMMMREQLVSRPASLGLEGSIATLGQWKWRLTQKKKEMAPRRRRARWEWAMASSSTSRPPEVIVAAGSTGTAASSPLEAVSPKPEGAQEDLEATIEMVIYRFRFMTMFAVLGSLIGSVLCFLKGCGFVIDSFGVYFWSRGNSISMLVEAIDIYLIGTVMLVFGMGLYELFISNLSIAEPSSFRSNFLGLFTLPERPKWLEIQSVNELKTRLGHVIVMVLLVGLVENSKKVIIHSPRDLLCFSASILLSSCGLYLLSMLGNSKRSKHD